MDGNASNATFNRRLNMNYIFALVFGLIHGLGFSNFLRSMLMPGKEDQLVMQLLAFNIGVELGQLTIVAVILFIAYMVMNPLRVKQREWNVFVSGAAAGIALIMALERIPF